MRNTSRSAIILFVITVLFGSSIACGSSTPASEAPEVLAATTESELINDSSSSEEVTQTTDIPPTVEATTAPELYLGDAVQSFGYILTALSVTDPAKAGMFFQAETGKKLVAVEVVISNVSSDVLGVNALNAKLVDNEGYVYEAELVGIDDQIATVDLHPGEQVRGWISFKIPENATASRIKYSTETFGSAFLEANLIAPPDGHEPVTISFTAEVPSSNLGDVVEQFGYSLSATTVENPAIPGILYTAKEGYKLVAVEITLANISATEELSVNALYAYLVDSDGFVYDVELGGRDDQIDTLDINLGEKVKGWISFRIPENATPSAIKYQIGVFSDNYLIAGVAEQ